jgi:hypothetical protein
MDWAIELRFQGLCAMCCLRFHCFHKKKKGWFVVVPKPWGKWLGGEIRDIFLQISR